MKILVSTAGRHGATDTLGRELARVFEHSGVDVDVRAPESVDCVDGYDALVIGSAVYSNRWIPMVNNLVAQLADKPHPPVWLFSCGPLHSLDRPVNDTPDAARATAALNAFSHCTFPGKLDVAELSHGEQLVFASSGAAEGDFRDWIRVCNWARDILASLASMDNENRAVR
nr:flavodoxin domain-containing protein [uncultured Rhodococcus sp.]